MKDSPRQLAGDLQDIIMRARDLGLEEALAHLRRAQRALDLPIRNQRDQDYDER